MDTTQTAAPVETISISDEDISVEVQKVNTPVSAQHAAQLGKIGPERGEQNFQNN